jgi:hypothetical protein
MKRIILFLFLATVALRAEKPGFSSFWDATKNIAISGDYVANAGPVWKTNGAPFDSDKTPPDFYRISVEEKTATGSKTLVEKQYPLNEVDWPRLKKSTVADIIKYQATTLRVGFFLKGPYATFVYTMPANAAAPAVTPEPVTPTPEAVPVTGPVVSDLAKAKRFVPSVVYHVQKGTKENKTKRWVKLPKLEIKTKDMELAAFTTALHTAIFAAAGPLPPGDGKVSVYIGPAMELLPVRKKLIPQSGNDNWNYWTNWNEQRELTGASIFILTDRMSPQEARQALARCLMGVAGFPDDSREYKESILYPDRQAVELAPIDKRLISFIYKHTEPGIAREALFAKLNQYWQ